ncbi:MAG: glycosyltransferase family 4 protein [Burkholderiales bacterium]
MLHVHQINLQGIVGGGEIYTRSFTRALADAGARVSLYVNPANRLWDGLAGERIECIPVPDEAELQILLPARAMVLTQGPLSRPTLGWLARQHVLTGFAHMPMYQRSPDEFRAYRLVFSVSRYCIELLRRAGIEQAYPEPVYGAIDLARSDEPVVLRSPLIVDRKKPRDVLLGRLEKLVGVRGAGTPFAKAPGLTLGIVSLLSPIKQFPALFSILAPALARRPQVRLEIFGNGGYGQIRHLKRALAPLGARARFWGFQPNVAAIYPQLDYLMTGLPEKEALGLNALEAQGCGTPVLAPAAPPFTETVVDGASGFLYRDPREDGGRHFEKILDAILAGKPRPDPRVAAKAHLEQFTHAALVERARRMLAALSGLE